MCILGFVQNDNHQPTIGFTAINPGIAFVLFIFGMQYTRHVKLQVFYPNFWTTELR